MGQSESYAYDANSNLSSRTDFNGHTTTYSYDTMNRLLSKTADPFFSQGTCAGGACGATQVSYTYTPTGRRASMTDASGPTTYTYDRVDRPLVKSTPFADVRTLWDLAGNQTLLRTEVVNGGASMSYAYDADNRLSSVTDAAGMTTNYIYDAVGNLGSFVYPNGVSTSYTYNSLDRLTTMQTVCGTAAPGCGTPGTQIASYSYTLGPAGNRLSVVELNGRNVNYGYDDLYRLTSETIAGATAQNGTISYQYDPAGNRKQLNSTVPAIPTGMLSYDANDRLSTDLYDNNGNTINTGGIGNAYDFENHLVQRGNVFIVYDGDGNRVSETVAGVTTDYVVADINPTGYAQVLDELPPQQPGRGVGSNRSYTYGLSLISQKLAASGSQLSFYAYDGHGSVRLLMDKTGAVTDTYDYDAFGNLLSSTGSTPNNYLFAGEQFDPALGIYYNRARYYDERSGRFWSMDPAQGTTTDPISLHKYLYGSANPINRTDPSGRDSVLDTLITAGAIATIAGVATTYHRCFNGCTFGEGAQAFTLGFAAGLLFYAFGAQAAAVGLAKEFLVLVSLFGAAQVSQDLQNRQFRLAIMDGVLTFLPLLAASGVLPGSTAEPYQPMPGSGPSSGVIEVSPRVKSVAAFLNFRPAEPVEFVFDPTTNTFAVGKASGTSSPHVNLADAIDADPNTVVGGTMIKGADGTVFSTENSGHYGQNWTPAVRSQYVQYLQSKTGVVVNHAAYEQ